MRLARTTTEIRRCERYDGGIDSIRRIANLVGELRYRVSIVPDSNRIAVGHAGEKPNLMDAGDWVWEGDCPRIQFGSTDEMTRGGWRLDDE